ncbi:MAG: glycosyltransferase family 2 protein, partial [bacterium]|nr:glycosyltransferase family 2 protein [bacterium]
IRMLSATIIICTKDREKDLARLLDSMTEQTRMPEELVVVDSGSDGAETHVRAFAERTTNCRVEYVHSEPGLTKQRNIGIGRATQDVIHFLDDDVVLDPLYVDEIQKTYETRDGEQVLAVGPVLEMPRPPSRFGAWYRHFFLLTHTDGTGRMQPSGYASLSWYGDFDDVHPIQVGCGCCTFRREVFDEIGFDEWFEGYGIMEDADFTLSVSARGLMLENPRARMLHLESPSARINLRRLVAMQIVNHHYVFKKHLPQDAFHWLCFWWAEFGEALRRFPQVLKTLNFGIVMGMIEGYRELGREKPRKVV